MQTIIFRKRTFSKKNDKYISSKYNKITYNDYDKNVETEIKLLKKAKYIESIFLSDNDELIYHYIKLLNIDHLFPLDISINKMMNDLKLYSNGNMIDFISYLLNK